MSVKLEELTWVDIEQKIEDGNRTVIVPVASTEQHGPHLPLATDALIGEELASRTAEKLGDTLVAPSIRPGCSGHHMDFPGSLTISSDLLIELIRDYCQSLESHGFEYIILLASHGGNFAPINTGAPEIARELDDAKIISLAEQQRFIDLINGAMKNAGLDYEEPTAHAGAGETSMILAIDEDLVKEDRAEIGYEDAISIPHLMINGLRYFTENGILGDATRGDREVGEKMLDEVSDAFAEDIAEKRADL